MATSKLNPNSSFRRSAGCSWSSIDGEVLILDMGTRQSHRLTGSGGLIWQRLMQGKSLQVAVDAVVAEYEVAPEIALADAVGLVERLMGIGVLVQE